LIRAIDRDGAKLFELTDAGRELLGERSEQAPPWTATDDPENVGDLRTQVKQLHVAAFQVAGVGSEEQIARAAGVLAEARRALYRILADDEGNDE
jgi:DNA-binding PadR family transcriptional regulator